MKILDLIKGISGTKKEEPSETLLKRINYSMKLLSEKAGILNSSFEAEKKKINEIAEETARLEESDEIFAAKLEQAILGNITATGSACESALAGGDPAKVKKAVANLQASVRQRTDMLSSIAKSSGI